MSRQRFPVAACLRIAYLIAVAFGFLACKDDVPQRVPPTTGTVQPGSGDTRNRNSGCTDCDTSGAVALTFRLKGPTDVVPSRFLLAVFTEEPRNGASPLREVEVTDGAGIPGFQPGTEYFFSVKGLDGSGSTVLATGIVMGECPHVRTLAREGGQVEVVLCRSGAAPATGNPTGTGSGSDAGSNVELDVKVIRRN